MLVINTRNDKLAAARVDFLSRGMLNGTCLGEVLCTLQDEETTSGSDADSDIDPDDENDNNEGNSCGPVDGPPVLSKVTLCSKKGIPVTTRFLSGPLYPTPNVL